MGINAGYGDQSLLGIREPEDVLSPRHYAAVRAGGRQMRSLPLWCYTSERFHDAEKEQIFLRSWNMLERTEIVPNPGDFRCMTLLDVPLVVTRGSDGKVRVFANTCRHRGTTIAEGSGHCKAFRCPYHSWTYGLDGRFIAAPSYMDPDGKPLIDSGNKEEFNLIEIESDTWGGFIFIRFVAGPMTLSQHLGTLVDTLASHELENMRCGKKVVYELDANWKCYIENYIDAYHLPYVHKNSLALWKSTGYWEPPARGEEFIGFVMHEGSQLLLPGPDENGFPPMPQIDSDKVGGTFFSILRPSVLMTIGNDGALVFQSEPISPGKSRLTMSSLFPESYFERPDFAAVAAKYYRRNDVVVGEDKDITLRQYAGLCSPYARIARLCRDEAFVHNFAQWIVDQVVGPEAVDGG